MTDTGRVAGLGLTEPLFALLVELQALDLTGLAGKGWI